MFCLLHMYVGQIKARDVRVLVTLLFWNLIIFFTLLLSIIEVFFSIEPNDSMQLTAEPNIPTHF
jgi:hypothetical protein